jgi:hypothetical protein
MPMLESAGSAGRRGEVMGSRMPREAPGRPGELVLQGIESRRFVPVCPAREILVRGVLTTAMGRDRRVLTRKNRAGGPVYRADAPPHRTGALF